MSTARCSSRRPRRRRTNCGGATARRPARRWSRTSIPGARFVAGRRSRSAGSTLYFRPTTAPTGPSCGRATARRPAPCWSATSRPARRPPRTAISRLREGRCSSRRAIRSTAGRYGRPTAPAAAPRPFTAAAAPMAAFALNGSMAFGASNSDTGYELWIAKQPQANVPTDISLSCNSVVQNQPVGTAVGTLSTTDTNSAATFSYSLARRLGRRTTRRSRSWGTSCRPTRCSPRPRKHSRPHHRHDDAGDVRPRADGQHVRSR